MKLLMEGVTVHEIALRNEEGRLRLQVIPYRHRNLALWWHLHRHDICFLHVPESLLPVKKHSNDRVLAIANPPFQTLVLENDMTASARLKRFLISRRRIMCPRNLIRIVKHTLRLHQILGHRTAVRRRRTPSQHALQRIGRRVFDAIIPLDQRGGGCCRHCRDRRQRRQRARRRIARPSVCRVTTNDRPAFTAAMVPYRYVVPGRSSLMRSESSVVSTSFVQSPCVRRIANRSTASANCSSQVHRSQMLSLVTFFAHCSMRRTGGGATPRMVVNSTVGVKALSPSPL